MGLNPLLYADSYKIFHYKMYPKGMTKLYSNFTPRKSRIPGVDKIVFFGLQHFIIKYLIGKFNENFFKTSLRKQSEYALKQGLIQDEKTVRESKAKIIKEYTRHTGITDTKHIEALWDLGYLPIEIKALPEGTLVPIGVPVFTITNTHPDFAWLVNYLETLLSAQLWQATTSATIAHEYRKILTKYAKETDKSNMEFIDWQGHDFSMRGMSSVESAILSGMGHLLSFRGTDTIPAIYALESSYKGEGLIGASVPATEHSVMCMGTKEDELGTFRRLMEEFPTGILSIVSDTWNLWDVCTKFLPELKDEILARDGKIVIRPDSGDPVDIICGLKVFNHNGVSSIERKVSYFPGLETVPINHSSVNPNELKGVIELLWETFGGTVNDQGYKVLDPHIGAIYGDSITLDRAKEICERLKAKGFASTNVVFGIGSFTYQYNTRDTFGFAMKATYGEVNIINERGVIVQESRKIQKNPITDSGEKKSKKGLLCVLPVSVRNMDAPESEITHSFVCLDQVDKEMEAKGALQTVFKDGQLIKRQTLEEIRNRLKLNNGTST